MIPEMIPFSKLLQVYSPRVLVFFTATQRGRFRARTTLYGSYIVGWGLPIYNLWDTTSQVSESITITYVITIGHWIHVLMILRFTMVYHAKVRLGQWSQTCCWWLDTTSWQIYSFFFGEIMSQLVLLGPPIVAVDTMVSSRTCDCDLNWSSN